MEIGPDQALKLCSALEFQLYQESLHPEILAFSEERIRKRVLRATELCQLWSERVRLEQERQATSASDSTRRRATTGYVTAELKAALFAQVLARFETRLAQQSRKTRSIPKPLGPV